MEDEFITQLLSKIKDTPENRRILTQFASGLRGVQQGIQTQKTLQKESTQGDGEQQKSILEVYYDQKTDALFPQDIQTLDTTGTSSSAQDEEKSFLTLERYEHICLLGKGGMGEVWKVRDRYLNRFVAMKIVQTNVQNSSDGLKRFIEEARVNAQLQHPNIVPVHDIGILDDGRYYFTMKEIQGRELCDVIADFHKNDDRAPSLYELMTIFHSVVDTIAFAHSHGVLHRDLKPSNILIGNFGEVLVLDWGIAKIINTKTSKEEGISSTQTIQTLYGSVTGTPLYMSPEQAVGGIKLDERADIYSLGAILYEILSGEPPYMGETAQDILQKVRNEHPTPLESFSKTYSSGRLNSSLQSRVIPPELIAICNRSMSRNKENRFVTAKEQAQRVQDWLMGLRKTRKAEESFEKAQAVWQDIEHKKRQNKQREKKCTQYFASARTLDEAWKVWDEYIETKRQIQTLSMKYKKLLDHTLFHDGNYRPAHIHMIRFLYHEQKIALKDHDVYAQTRIKLQYKKHKSSVSNLDVIPKKYTSILEDTPVIPFMIGRKKEQKDILLARKNNVSIIGITGYVGIGKKLLVKHIEQHLLQDAQKTIVCSLLNIKDPNELWQQISLALRVQIRAKDPVEEITSILSIQDVTLILYDVDGYVDEIVQAIQYLQKNVSSLKIIYTSVQKLNIAQEYTVTLSPLSQFESILFFVYQAQQIIPHFMVTPSNKTNVFDICARLGGFPLALEIATAHLRSQSIGEIHTRIMQNTLPQTQQNEVLRQAWTLSWERLSNKAQQLCIQLLIFPESASYESIEQILSSPEEAVLDILQQLVHHHLVCKEADRYSILPSIRPFIEEKSNIDAQEKQRLLKRHAQYYARKINKKNLLLLEVMEKQEDNIRSECTNFIIAAQNGTPTDAATCAIAASTILYTSGTLQKANTIIDCGLKHKNLPKELYWGLRIKKGRNLRLLGQPEEARTLLSQEVIEKSMQTSAEPKTLLPFWEAESRFSTFAQLQTLEAYRRMDLGSIAYNEGDLEKAHQLYSSSMERFKSIHHQRGVSLILNGLGNINLGRGRVQKALSMYKEATTIAQNIQFLRHAGVCLSQQANIYRSQEKYEQAILCYKEAISILKKSADHTSFASVLGNLALLYAKMGDRENAIIQYKECIDVCIKKGNKKFEGINRGNLAEELYSAGYYEESIDMFEKAIAICVHAYPVAEISFRVGLALAYIKVDRISQAKRLVEKDDIILKKIPLEYIEYLHAKVQVYIELKDKDTARVIFSELEDFISKNPSVYRKEYQKKRARLQRLLID